MTGNVLYRFGFNFGLGLSKTSVNATLKITDGHSEESHERVSEINTTAGPVLETIWSQQDQLNEAASDKLQSTRDAVTQLKAELFPIIGRNSFLASKVTLMSKYLLTANNVINDDNASENRFKILMEFVQLVDDLREPPSVEEGGKSSLEYTTMKLLIEKYKLIELQTEILVDILQAVEIWQKYTETQLLETITV